MQRKATSVGTSIFCHSLARQNACHSGSRLQPSRGRLDLCLKTCKTELAFATSLSSAVLNCKTDFESEFPMSHSQAVSGNARWGGDVSWAVANASDLKHGSCKTSEVNICYSISSDCWLP